MMKKIWLYSIAMLLGLVAKGQQNPQFTQFSENRYVLNPAATGVQEYWSANIGYRRQWFGLGQEPTTFYAGAHTGLRHVVPPMHQPLALRTAHPEDFSFEQHEEERSKLKHGIGAYIMGDQYGKFIKNSFNLSYALHLPLTSKITASLGANAGIHNLKFDDNNILENDSDPTYDRFAAENASRSMMDANLGTYIYSDHFFVGYSTAQLAGDQLSLGVVTERALVLHHTIMAGYGVDVNDKFRLTPSVYARAIKGVTSYDLNLRADYDKFFGAVTYRNQDAMALAAGITLKDMIRISYAYDINLNALKQYSSGGHEIVLGFMFKNNSTKN